MRFVGALRKKRAEFPIRSLVFPIRSLGFALCNLILGGPFPCIVERVAADAFAGRIFWIVEKKKVLPNPRARICVAHLSGSFADARRADAMGTRPIDWQVVPCRI